MVLGLEGDDPIAGDIDAVQQEQLGIDRLVALRADEHVHVAHDEAGHLAEVPKRAAAHRGLDVELPVGDALDVRRRFHRRAENVRIVAPADSHRNRGAGPRGVRLGRRHRIDDETKGRRGLVGLEQRLEEMGAVAR